MSKYEVHYFAYHLDGEDEIGSMLVEIEVEDILNNLELDELELLFEKAYEKYYSINQEDDTQEFTMTKVTYLSNMKSWEADIHRRLH
jgi:hypothetical protein